MCHHGFYPQQFGLECDCSDESVFVPASVTGTMAFKSGVEAYLPLPFSRFSPSDRFYWATSRVIAAAKGQA